MRQVLLLAGTAEARELAVALAAMPGIAARASLAGATRNPAALPLPTRIGGFGGAGAFAAYLRDEGIGAVIDATHPFAARISARSAAVCAAQGVPYLAVQRPGWQPQAGDRWVTVDSVGDAARVIPARATVFVATGRSSVAQLDPRCTLHVRVIDPPTVPFPHPRGSFVVGRAPFTVAGEVALFRRLGIDWLLVKDAGGDGGFPKLLAARELGLPVAMVRRPEVPGPAVGTVAEALDWLRGLA